MVDGIEREFSQIDPNEIESISVLKDASSTAVFGVRGANGVVLITTRRGKAGKTQISASTKLGLQQPISLVEQTGSYEFARFWNMKQEMDHVTNPKLYFTPEQVEAYRTGSDPIMYPSMDWKKYIFNNVYLQARITSISPVVAKMYDTYLSRLYLSERTSERTSRTDVRQ